MDPRPGTSGPRRARSPRLARMNGAPGREAQRFPVASWRARESTFLKARASPLVGLLLRP